jgi:hypothetical protein
MDNAKKIYEMLQPLGLKPLNKVWAKAEIFIGLACVYVGILGVSAPSQSFLNRPFGWTPPSQLETLVGFLIPLLFFVLGGYLAMAGHRSHIYQSNNLLTAFLAEEIRKKERGICA